jgi:CheY-like chemotaxis protein
MISALNQSQISMTSTQTQQPLPAVLVVDDNALIRHMVTNILNDHGMRALSASCANEAFAIMDELEADPSLLISDISMPGMSGIEMAKIAEGRCPGLKVLFISSRPDLHDDIPRQGVTDNRLLRKPFQRADLLDCVTEMLELR